MTIESVEFLRENPDVLTVRLRDYERLEEACRAFKSDDLESWKAVIHALDALAEGRRL